MLLVAEVVGLHKIDDAPQVEHAVLDRRTGQRQLVLGLKFLDGFGHLRPGILDELRLVEHNSTEGKFGQLAEVTAKDRVIRDHDVVVGDSLSKVVTRLATLQNQHLHIGSEPFRFTTPVVQNRSGANYQRRLGLGILPATGLQPQQPSERLQCLAQSHIVRKDSTQLKLGQVAKKTKAFHLIRTQLGANPVRQFSRFNSLKLIQASTQLFQLRGRDELGQSVLIQVGGLL